MIADRRLGRRRENRLRQLRCFLQTGRKLDAAYGAGVLVFLPARSGQVTAHYRFHRHRLQALGDNRTAFHLWQVGGADQIFGAVAGQMIRHHVFQLLEPEVGNRGENFALVRNRFRQDHIERRQAVGGDHQHALGIDFVQIAHLAGVDLLQALQIGFGQAVHAVFLQVRAPGLGRAQRVLRIIVSARLSAPLPVAARCRRCRPVR